MSLLNLRIDGLERLNQKFIDRATAVRDVTQPLRTAGILSADAGRRRIKVGGEPTWPPSIRAERLGGTTGYDTGTMFRSIIASEPVGGAGGSGKVDVGVSGPAGKYAVIFQRGSGSRGGGSDWTTTRPPKNRGAVSWVSGGKRYVQRGATIKHRGQVPRPFLYFDDGLRQMIERVFRSFVKGES